MVDLHTHSRASDGDFSPAALAGLAAEKGLRALALTDHDTISGLAEAQKAASERGIAFIPGVELEIDTENAVSALGQGISGEFHLLGLGITSPTGLFVEKLRFLAGARDRRNRKIIEKMKEAGIQAEIEDIAAFAGGGLLGRPHFGAFLISRKIVKNQEQAFKRYLGKGRPFFVPKEGMAFSEAAELIHDSGGIAVLAHPLSLYVAWGKLPSLVGSLKEMGRHGGPGLDGLEAWHPTAGVRACKRLEELARSFGLIVTAGSDFHGSARPERKLGLTAGGRKIEDRFLEGIPGV
jgi:predicted metal-dependent phosphoesterase TrpH